MLAESRLCAGAIFGLISGEDLGVSPKRRAGFSFLETLSDNLAPCVSNMRAIVM
jgi:hypothetical protein